MATARKRWKAIFWGEAIFRQSTTTSRGAVCTFQLFLIFPLRPRLSLISSHPLLLLYHSLTSPRPWTLTALLDKRSPAIENAPFIMNSANPLDRHNRPLPLRRCLRLFSPPSLSSCLPVGRAIALDSDLELVLFLVRLDRLARPRSGDG
ncbi:hypothetical protein NUW54_g7748 [Trametes sanguinea]|uniref:Uncharacterized protein n=1 Tax=Trametes sanguinea TaxID=158606 RepID=A0ACC1PIB9_9APHY|nr:hypothetical protein NUW54_g7748 [Trametes sanguinea]